jgi:hypothetical protein
MSEWTDGYRAALSDVRRLTLTRDPEALPQLLTDLEDDVLVIEREQGNVLRRRRLRVEREALPLFEGSSECP